MNRKRFDDGWGDLRVAVVTCFSTHRSTPGGRFRRMSPATTISNVGYSASGGRSPHGITLAVVHTATPTFSGETTDSVHGTTVERRMRRRPRKCISVADSGDDGGNGNSGALTTATGGTADNRHVDWMTVTFILAAVPTGNAALTTAPTANGRV